MVIEISKQFITLLSVSYLKLEFLDFDLSVHMCVCLVYAGIFCAESHHHFQKIWKNEHMIKAAIPRRPKGRVRILIFLIHFLFLYIPWLRNSSDIFHPWCLDVIRSCVILLRRCFILTFANSEIAAVQIISISPLEHVLLLPRFKIFLFDYSSWPTGFAKQGNSFRHFHARFGSWAWRHE